MFFEINKTLFIYLNSLADSDLSKNIVFLFADSPIFFIPIFLIIAWIYYRKQNDKKNILLYIFYSTILWISFSLLIQHFIQIDRPEIYIQNAWNLLLKHIPDASFPSDHATISTAFVTSLFYTNYKKIWYIFLPFIIIMDVSRIIAWVHWPFDIVAWIIVWILSSFLIFKYINKLDFVRKINTIIIKLLSYIKL